MEIYHPPLYNISFNTYCFRLKVTNENLENMYSQIESAMQESDILSKWSENPKILEKVTNLQTEWQRLTAICSEKILFYESAIAEHSSFQQDLHNIENWISQMATQSMEQNLICFKGKDETEALISQQNILMQEIERYFKNLKRNLLCLKCFKVSVELKSFLTKLLVFQ